MVSWIFNKPHILGINLLIFAVIREMSALKIFCVYLKTGLNMYDSSLLS